MFTSCFPPSQSGRPWYGESYARTEAFQREKAEMDRKRIAAGERSDRYATARREYQQQEAERQKQYQTRSWCEFHNNRRKREALAKGSQSYHREDCSKYPR